MRGVCLLRDASHKAVPYLPAGLTAATAEPCGGMSHVLVQATLLNRAHPCIIAPAPHLDAPPLMHRSPARALHHQRHQALCKRCALTPCCTCWHGWPCCLILAVLGRRTALEQYSTSAAAASSTAQPWHQSAYARHTQLCFASKGELLHVALVWRHCFGPWPTAGALHASCCWLHRICFACKPAGNGCSALQLPGRSLAC